MNKYIEKFKIIPNPLIVSRLNSGKLSDEEMDAAISVLNLRNIDTSIWSKSTEDDDDEYEALIKNVELALDKIDSEGNEEKAKRVEKIWGNKNLEELPEDDLEEILRIAEMLKPEPKPIPIKKKVKVVEVKSMTEKWQEKYPPKQEKPKVEITPKPEKVAEPKPKKKRAKKVKEPKIGRPAGVKNTKPYKNFPKAQQIIERLEKGMSINEIAMEGIASFSYVQRIRLKLNAEKQGVTKRYLESYYTPVKKKK
jgi:SHS2 domain-containing protein